MKDFNFCKFRVIKVGPFHIVLFAILLFTTFIYQVTKPRVPEDSETQDEERKWFLISIPLIIVSMIVFAILFMTSENQAERAILCYLLLAISHQIIPFYFIMTLPNLKKFAAYTIETTFKTVWIFKLCRRNNEVLPI